MTAQRPDFPVDEDAGLVKFSQVSEDQTSRSMRLLDLYEKIPLTFSFASILPPDFKLKLGGQSQPQQAVSPALTLRERGDFGCSQQAGSRVS